MHNSNKDADRLFSLVHSLSKSEKRYFTIFSSRHVIGEENNYLLLFKAVERMSFYDEKQLLKTLEGHNFTKRLAVTKAYLYDLILRCLQSFHSQKSISNQVLNGIQQVAILYDKNLLQEAIEKLDKLEDIAEQNELIAYLPILFNWKKKILEANFYNGKEANAHELLFQKAKTMYKQLENINEFWRLDAQLYSEYNRKGIVRKKEDLNQIEKVLDSPLLRNEDKALSFEALYLQTKVFATYFFILRDFGSCYNHVIKLVELIESNPNYIQNEPFNYVYALNNLLNITGVLKKYEISKTTLQKLHSLLLDKQFVKSKKLELKLFEAYYYHRLTLLLENKNYIEAAIIEPAIDEGLQKWQSDIDPMGKLMLCYLNFQVCYGNKDYTKASKWLERIFEGRVATLRHDIYGFAAVLQMMLHYDRADQAAFDQATIHCYKFLMRKENKYRFDEIVLSFIKDLKHLKNKEMLQERFLSLQQALNELAEDPFEKKAFSYFDFRTWLDDKINSTQISPLVKV